MPEAVEQEHEDSTPIFEAKDWGDAGTIVAGDDSGHWIKVEEGLEDLDDWR